MNNFVVKIIIFLNRFFRPAGWFDILNKADDETLNYALKSGEVVLNQFYGFSDIKNKVVVDYGCGFGGKTAYYASMGASKVYGVDFHEDYDLVKNYCSMHALNVEFIRIKDANKIPIADASVDIVISSAVFEHVTEVDKAMSEVMRILKPNSLFLNRWHPYATRYGSHVNGLIGIPFVHLIFSESSIMRAYTQLLEAKTTKIGKTLLYKVEHQRTNKWSDIGLSFNFFSIKQMRKVTQDNGFKVVEKRYFFGKKELRFIRFLPDSIKTFFIDYEILICKKNA